MEKYLYEAIYHKFFCNDLQTHIQAKQTNKPMNVQAESVVVYHTREYNSII